MEDVLQRLLDAELQSEALVKEAEHKRERLIRQALDDTRAAEKQFEARLPDLRNAFVEKAEERAAQAVAEQTRRYEEWRGQLQAQARERQPDAVAAAVALLLDTGKG
ncbi:MAG TPA: hypothetical protein VGA00_07105 [Acidiferrobacterales bacterium]|jgi:vacuolar-type H+-ATPase subunit H